MAPRCSDAPAVTRRRTHGRASDRQRPARWIVAPTGPHGLGVDFPPPAPRGERRGRNGCEVAGGAAVRLKGGPTTRVASSARRGIFFRAGRPRAIARGGPKPCRRPRKPPVPHPAAGCAHRGRGCAGRSHDWSLSISLPRTPRRRLPGVCAARPRRARCETRRFRRGWRRGSAPVTPSAAEGTVTARGRAAAPRPRPGCGMRTCGAKPWTPGRSPAPAPGCLSALG